MPNANKLRSFKINIPIYDVSLRVLVCDESKASRWCNVNGYKGFDKKDRIADGLVLEKGGEFLIWRDEFNWNIYDMQVLAHELIHVGVEILGQVHIPIERNNNEAFAYLYDFMFEKVFTKLRPRKKKKCKKR